MNSPNHFADLLQTAIEKVMGVESGSAQVITEKIFIHLQKKCGGRMIYIPAKDNSKRNEEILEKFNGRNHAEVCRQFNISLATLYRVIQPSKNNGLSDDC